MRSLFTGKQSDAYKPGDFVDIDFKNSEITIGNAKFRFEPLPDKLKQIIDMKGLVNYMKSI